MENFDHIRESILHSFPRHAAAERNTFENDTIRTIDTVLCTINAMNIEYGLQPV